MIAFHKRKPFYVDVSIDGRTRKGKRSHPPPTCEQRWFYPPRSQRVREHALDENALQEYIRHENNRISDVVPNRAMERLRGDDQIQMINNTVRLGGLGRDIAGTAGDTFSLVGDIGGFLDLDSAAADMPDVVGSFLQSYQ